METILRPPAFTLERLRHSLRILPQYTDLFLVLTAHRIKVRYRQSVLGPLWAVLQPLGMMLIVVAVFSVISARAPSDGHPYALFAYTGLLAWSVFASAVGSGVSALVAHAPLVTRVSFPREILPLTYVAAALFDFLIASSILLLLFWYYDVALTPAALWAVPLVLLLSAIAAAVSLLLSAINARYRDVTVAMPLLLQFWMFASPIIYPLSAVPAEWRGWYLLNPLAGTIDGFRRVLLNGTDPDGGALLAAVAVTGVALPAAYLFFKHVDATIADRM